MDAARYSASLDTDHLFEQSEHLAQAMYLFFDAGASDGDSLTPDRCIACRHFAWQLVQHVKRLHEEYGKTFGPSPRGHR